MYNILDVNIKKSKNVAKEEQILGIVRKQKAISKPATDAKKQLFRQRKELYANINRYDKKVNINLIRQFKQTLMALYFFDEIQAKFTSTDLFTWEKADNINNLAKYEYTNLDMDTTDYLVQDNKFEYGMGARVIKAWNPKTNTIDFTVLDSLAVFPDPNGRFHINDFEFFGFECQESIDNVLSNKDFYNLDMVEHSFISNSQQLINIAEQQPRVIYNQDGMQSASGDMITLYYHYCVVDGERLQVVTTYDETILLSAKVIEPLEAVAEIDASPIKFPLALNYREPKKGDPRGICIYDIAEDKQKFMSLYANLMTIKAQKEALGDIVFIDSGVYQENKTALLKPTTGFKYISVKSNGQPMDKIAYPLPQVPISTDVYQMTQFMENQAKSDMWISDLTRGVNDGQAKTATQVQTEQLNQNISLLLGSKINSKGEKVFRKLWYLRYYHYFSAKDKKYIEINKWISTVGDEITRKDIILPTIPNITIATKSVIEAENQKQAQWLEAMLPMFLTDMTLPEVSKRFLKRKLLLLKWFPRQEVEIEIALTADEMDAREDVQFLNRNLPVNINNMNEDHLTYLIIYQSALSTAATKAAIMARKEAYIQSGQQQMQQQSAQLPNAMGWIANSMGNQMMANNLKTPQAQPLAR